MVIAIVDERGVFTVERKGRSPVFIYPNRPMSFEIAFE